MSRNKLKEFTFYDDKIKRERKKAVKFIELDYVDDSYKELMSNPFLYTYENSLINVSSIEDFGINYKSKNIFLGSIIRNPNIKKKKRIKITKAYFLKNKKEYLKEMKSLKKKKCDTFKVSKVSIKHKLFYILSFILSLFLMISYFDIIKIKFIQKDNTYVKYSVIFMLAITSLIFIEFIYYGIRYMIFLYQRKTYNTRIRKILKNHFRIFKKVYSKVYRYYKKHVTRGSLEFTPRGLEEVWMQKSDLNGIKEMMDIVLIKTDKLQKYQMIRKKITIGLCFLEILSQVAFIILNVVYMFIE